MAFNFDEAVLKKLTKYFFNGSLNYSLMPDDIELITWDKQQLFLEATVHSEVIKKYPVSNEFCRLFFKKLIGYLETYQEVHDDFYNYLCSVMKNERAKDSFCYRHYIVNDQNDVITMKETNKMVVNGTTGMRTWEAALMLSDWALSNKKVFENKNILELGSGVGFTGVTITKLCKPKSFMFTDCHSEVLSAICDNIKINFDSLDQEQKVHETKFKDDKNVLGVMMLDWNCIENLSDDVVPDVLIGADIVYDPSILHPLCNVIKTFFDRNINLEVYISNIIRNEETLERFLEILNSMNLTYEEISQTRSIFIDWDNKIPKCLLKIKLKS